MCVDINGSVLSQALKVAKESADLVGGASEFQTVVGAILSDLSAKK